jgi:hypothetical protein
MSQYIRNESETRIGVLGMSQKLIRESLYVSQLLVKGRIAQTRMGRERKTYRTSPAWERDHDSRPR